MKVLKQGIKFVQIYLFSIYLLLPNFISITIRLAFHKQQDLCQTSGAVNNIAECPTLNKTEMLKEGNMHPTDK